jgi:predicted nucleotidyltransferase component of viral defense system
VDLRERLAFKGGTAIKRCYFGDYRFSEDLDFSLAEETSLDSILKQLAGVFDSVRAASGIVLKFSRKDRKQHHNSHTFYLTYEGPLPTGVAKEVKVDVTIRERFVCPFEQRPVLRGYEEYGDLPDGCRVQVYSLDEIAVEKVVALTDPARNEPRDLYDVWYLTGNGHVDLAMLIPEIVKKLGFRGRTVEGLLDSYCRKEARYKKLWSGRLGSQIAALPPVDDVFRSVTRTLRGAGLTGTR